MRVGEGSCGRRNCSGVVHLRRSGVDEEHGGGGYEWDGGRA